MPGGEALVASLAAANMLMRVSAAEELQGWELAGRHPNQKLARQVLFHYGVPDLAIVPGGFFRALIDACAKADPENRLRLSLAFPVLVWTLCAVELLPDGTDRLVALLEREAGT
jgi:hypothetical protein